MPQIVVPRRSRFRYCQRSCAIGGRPNRPAPDAQAEWRSRMSTNHARPRRPRFCATAIALLFGAVSCAAPPTTASVTIPPIPPQQARVWFYREVEPHAVNQTTPYVRLNGAIAGVADQGGAFYRNVPPGHYQIMIEGGGMSPSPSRDVALLAGEQ